MSQRTNVDRIRSGSNNGSSWSMDVKKARIEKGQKEHYNEKRKIEAGKAAILSNIIDPTKENHRMVRSYC